MEVGEMAEKGLTIFNQNNGLIIQEFEKISQKLISIID
jgi:hypothetical protein